MDRTVHQYLSGLHGRSAAHRQSTKAMAGTGDVQIAFYGGNFTGLPEGDQEALLRLAAPYIAKGVVDGIRISTRPDYIRREQMAFLRRYNVRTVEIGAQSLVEDVLSASRRGHTAADVSRAVALLKAEGIEVGLHLMAGLPGDSPERFAASVEAAVALAPDMIRIHPTLVLRDTALVVAYGRGEYVPLSLEEAVCACKYAVNRFAGAGIPVIRVGLQTTAEMEQPGAVVAGPFHPAFGALVESSALLDQASAMLGEMDVKGRRVVFHVPPRKESSFRGQRNENLKILAERFGLAGIELAKGDVFRITL
ncbi:MAG: hypothetical protein CSYNP_03213 [Syntrophus sp. SKADARSKE-3]|nr:hypothetical protein [Syntrophus sp. SKADARSKE-3]